MHGGRRSVWYSEALCKAILFFPTSTDCISISQVQIIGHHILQIKTETDPIKAHDVFTEVTHAVFAQLRDVRLHSLWPGEFEGHIQRCGSRDYWHHPQLQEVLFSMVSLQGWETLCLWGILTIHHYQNEILALEHWSQFLSLFSKYFIHPRHPRNHEKLEKTIAYQGYDLTKRLCLPSEL